jgi:hypothetical protein
MRNSGLRATGCDANSYFEVEEFLLMKLCRIMPQVLKKTLRRRNSRIDLITN